MTDKQDWRTIVASSLDWEQAHATLENSVKGFPVPLRGERPAGYPHSAWELLEHMRITQRDCWTLSEPIRGDAGWQLILPPTPERLRGRVGHDPEEFRGTGSVGPVR